ncbi:MAG: hypothetical protein MZV64_16855 [Ignavibacteriales bacterium]|nr:hypothetical protein [Ignavibacteriales bacterium]
MLADPDYEALVRAYTFLRRLEHRLQIIARPPDPHAARRRRRRSRASAAGWATIRPSTPTRAPHSWRITNATRPPCVSSTTASSGRRDPRQSMRATSPRTRSSCSSRRICPRSRSASGWPRSGSRMSSARSATCKLMREGQSFARYTPEVRRASAGWRRRSCRRLAEVADPDLALTTFERFIAGVAARTHVHAAAGGESWDSSISWSASSVPASSCPPRCCGSPSCWIRSSRPSRRRASDARAWSANWPGPSTRRNRAAPPGRAAARQEGRGVAHRAGGRAESDGRHGASSAR